MYKIYIVEDDPALAQALKNAIIRLTEDEQLYRQMGENGKRIVREKFNWASQEKKLLGVYKNILGK